MTTRTVSSGYTVTGGRITSGNEEVVLFGGTVDGAVVTNGGVLSVTGGTANHVRVTSGGDLLMSGGYAVDLVMGRLANATISSGHIADATISDAYAELRRGTVANGSLVENGGLLVAEAGSTAHNTTLTAGGQLVVAAGTSVSDVKIDNGVVTLAFDASLTGKTVFAGKGEIQDQSATGISLSTAGFGAGDSIDLMTFASGKAEKLSVVENVKKTWCILTVTDGTHHARIAVFGQYVAAGFHVVTDHLQGTFIEYSAPAAAHPDLAAAHR